MARCLIRIRWDSATEFISVDPADASISGKCINTKEYWHEERETVAYTVLCTGFTTEGTKTHLSLEYREGRNPALKGRNDTWGKSEITINASSGRVKATWSDLRKSKFYSGPAKSCSLLDDCLLDELSYESISRIRRPKQSAVRQDLLKLYGKCALTEETTKAVLDVAHIIEAGKSGSYTYRNCVLLRSDLHRLFDRIY